MRKFTALFVASTLALGATSMAFAADTVTTTTAAPTEGKMMMHHKGKPGMHEMMMFKDLNLTDAQKQQIRDIMKSEKTDYLDRAISALGAVGTADDALFLVDYLSGEIAGDDKQRLIVRQNVMFALGELKAVETWDSLAAIVADTDENAFIRADNENRFG